MPRRFGNGAAAREQPDAGELVRARAASTRVTCWRARCLPGWLAGPSFAMSEDDGDRLGWPGLEATRRYWLFVDLVWLLIVIGFYVVAVRPQEIPRLPPSCCALQRLRKPGL